MPSELLIRLKTCAKANHKYQYRLVTESLDEFLTSKGFAKVPEVEEDLEVEVNGVREVEVKPETQDDSQEQPIRLIQ